MWAGFDSKVPAVPILGYRRIRDTQNSNEKAIDGRFRLWQVVLVRLIRNLRQVQNLRPDLPFAWPGSCSSRRSENEGRSIS